MNLEWTDATFWLQLLLFMCLVLLALPALLASLYLLWLTAFSRAPAPRAWHADTDSAWRFDIIVPAHDEADGIGAAVRNLLAVDWPRGGFRVLVVADNCSDATAEHARHAGAVVLARCDPALRGKGHALRLGFQASLQDAEIADPGRFHANAAVIVDADSRVSPNLLRAMAARLTAGAQVAQVFHGVLDADRNPRNRLMAIAYSTFHRVRSRGREWRGLSCGIRGNGWCITHQTLRDVPYAAHGLAEDIEYGLRLGIAGVRVAYIDDAQVLSSMETDAIGAASQRNRWEQGRSTLPRMFTRTLLGPTPADTRALRRDLGFDLLVPPLATIGFALLLLLTVSIAAQWMLPETTFPKVFVAMGLVSLCALGLHVARGWQLSETGARGLLDLAAAPRFAFWKLALRLRPRADTAWVRTRRLGS